MKTKMTIGLFLALIIGSTSCRDFNLIDDDQKIYADVTAKYWDSNNLPADSVKWDSAIIVAKVHYDGGSPITECGFYYSTDMRFSIKDTVSGTVHKVVSTDYADGNKYFSALLTGLTEQTTYYYVAYVVNETGVSYSSKTFPDGNTLSSTINEKFTTPPHYRVPELETAIFPIEITHISATVDNYITHWGNYKVIENGLYWSDNVLMLGKKKVASSAVITGANGSFRVSISGLQPLTTYFYQAYAVNSFGEGVGNVCSFTTTKTPDYPVLSATTGAENVTENSANITFRLDDSKGGTISEYGYYINGLKMRVSNTALAINGTFKVALTNLSSNTSYEIYAYAINPEGENTKPIATVTFKTGIRGRSDSYSTDHNLYFELPGIESNGKVYRFLDRNLGATTTTNVIGDDIESAGWLFQWGRAADGHQIWRPTPSAVENITADPTNETTGRAVKLPFANGDARIGKFIANSSTDTKLRFQWIAPTEDNLKLWSESEGGGINNPCPKGYRVPTLAEIKLLGSSATTLLNTYGIPIKVANFRASSSGAIQTATGVGSILIKYWTCTAAIDATSGYIAGSVLRISPTNGTVTYYTDYNGAGYFVRCVSENTVK